MNFSLGTITAPPAMSGLVMETWWWRVRVKSDDIILLSVEAEDPEMSYQDALAQANNALETGVQGKWFTDVDIKVWQIK